jgi:dolichyl-phosphate-mannose-protein mannosyltransferase
MRLKSGPLVLALVLVYAAAFRLATINRPFFDDAEGSGCLNGVLARNYLRFGWTATHGMPVLSSGPPGASPIVFYPDHPPMLPLLIAPFYALFGVGAWQTRLPISILTLAAIIVLYRLVAEWATPRAGALAAAVFAATPMTLNFGGFPDVVGTPLVFFVLLTVLAYLRFHRAPGFAGFAWLLIAFVLAGLCDWPAYTIVPVFAVHFIATRPRGDWPWIVGFGAAASALFGATYIYITIATHSPWTWMVPLFSRRSSLVGGTPFTAGQWIGAAAAFNRTYHTTALLLAATVWLAALPTRLRSAPGAMVAHLLLAWAALYIVIGSKALYDHEWAWLPLTPGLTVACALLLDRVLTLADSPAVRTAARWIVACLVAAFGASTAYATFSGLYAVDLGLPFTPMEMGLAIQVAARGPRDVALLLGNDTSAQLWFYGDRPLRAGIWSPDDFEARLDDDRVDLMFDFDEQPWSARASGFVFPKAREPEFAVLKQYLSARYPLAPLPPSLTTKFDVFDLRHPFAWSGRPVH